METRIIIAVSISFLCLPLLLSKGGIDQEKHDYYLMLAAKVEPTGRGDIKQAQHYLDRIKRIVLSDPYYFYFDLHFDPGGGNPIIAGDVERMEFKDITIGVLKILGLKDLKFDIKVIPHRGGPVPLFGIINKPCSFMTSRPERAGNPMDEALYGEPVYILKESGDCYLVKNYSGYFGYVEKKTVKIVRRQELAVYEKSEKILLKNDFKTGEIFFPAGSYLRLKSWREKSVGEKTGGEKSCKVLTLENRVIEIPTGLCVKNERGKKVTELLKGARSFLGTKYRLGGKNSITGIDCSGLVQVNFRKIGVNLPRDAKQQYLCGNLVGTSYFLEALKPGDTLYFMDYTGRVVHTGIYLGNELMIHSTTYENNKVQVHSINPASGIYYKSFGKAFVGAKRIVW